MGKKKMAEKEEPKAEETDFHFSDIVHSDAKRSIAAVFLFAFSIILLLGYVDAAGKIGGMLDHGVGLLFGYGKWLFPFLLMIAGIMFLTRRATTLADAVKYIGLLLAFFSLLGLTHLFSGENVDSLMAQAEQGLSGGFVGFGLSALLLASMGKLAGSIVLVAVFSIGIIAAFNVSLMQWLDTIRGRFGKNTIREDTQSSEEEGIEGNQSVHTQDQSVITADTLLQLDETIGSPRDEAEERGALLPLEPELTLADGNIEKIHFHDEEPVSSEQRVDEGMDDVDAYDGVTEDRDAEDIEPATIVKRRRRRARANWLFPKPDLLESQLGEAVGGNTEQVKHIIVSTLKHFGVVVEPGDETVGPTVTRYTFRPAFGVKLSRITTLSNDLALALAADSIRIEAPIPGQSYIGIEIPNKTKSTVRMREIVESHEFRNPKLPLLIGIGQDVTGKNIFADLGDMPHLLIAGRTKSGKSVCINTILMSLLYKNSPDDLKLILIDPKRVELSMYKGIPHLKADVVTDGKKVVNVLGWAISEMERRYKILEAVRVRDLPAYHALCREGYQKTTIDDRTGEVHETDLEPLPFFVIVIDELAEIMVAYGKEVEPKIVRLAQMSRAVGIHLILATQRPSVEVITGLIKTNLPTRIAFQVSSQIDSRTILDGGGAEKLLGNGDMLFVASDGDVSRLQGAYVSTDEVHRVTQHWRDEKEIWSEGDSLDDDITAGDNDQGSGRDSVGSGEYDELFEQAKDLFIRSQKASTTSLQTAFGIGYPRAARLMHTLEEQAVVGMVDGKKQVLIGRDMVAPADQSVKPAYGDDALRDQAERDTWQA